MCVHGITVRELGRTKPYAVIVVVYVCIYAVVARVSKRTGAVTVLESLC